MSKKQTNKGLTITVCAERSPSQSRFRGRAGLGQERGNAQGQGAREGSWNKDGLIHSRAKNCGNQEMERKPFEEESQKKKNQFIFNFIT